MQEGRGARGSTGQCQGAWEPAKQRLQSPDPATQEAGHSAGCPGQQSPARRLRGHPVFHHAPSALSSFWSTAAAAFTLRGGSEPCDSSLVAQKRALLMPWGPLQVPGARGQVIGHGSEPASTRHPALRPGTGLTLTQLGPAISRVVSILFYFFNFCCLERK